MATEWFNPRTILQYPEGGAENIHLQWDESTNFSGLISSSGNPVGTLGDLIHIARSPKPSITNKTYYLKMTHFNFTGLPDVITGIELKISSKRQGRITDDTVSLTYNDELFGDNQANLNVDPVKYYGGETFLWGLGSIPASTIQNSSFGVIVRFKSHPQWPHRDPIDLLSVQLRIH